MLDKERPNINAQYIPEQRTVEVLNILKKISDEKHPVTKADVKRYTSTTENPQTLSNTIDEILLGINPVEYDDNDEDYRIKYNGYEKPYEENPLVIKSEINELHKELRRKDADADAITAELDALGKAPSISGLRYIHDFDYGEMDSLISAVALSAAIEPSEKERLIKKIVNTASIYYKTPFYDRALGTLRFDPYASYSRLYSKSGETEKRISENIKLLQEAFALRTKVRFHFDVYGANKEYVSDEKWHIITPYYIVTYLDNYYVIGAWDTGANPCHYRIDLMSDVRIVREEDGTPVKMRPISECSGLPGREGWDPERYMSEHLYMAYSTDDAKPRRISLKIPSYKINRYTILHDWFGDNFTINKTKTRKCGEGFEVVDVVTSPTMLVHWAMQYADFVEVLDDEVREGIRKEIDKLSEKYL